MKYSYYGKHGARFGTGTLAKKIYHDIGTMIGLAAFLGLPVWWLLLGL